MRCLIKDKYLFELNLAVVMTLSSGSESPF